MIPSNLALPTAEIFNSALEHMLRLVFDGLDGDLTEFFVTLIVYEQRDADAATFDPHGFKRHIGVIPEFHPDDGEAMMDAIGYQAGLEQRLVAMIFLKHEAWMRHASKKAWQGNPLWPTEAEERDEVVLVKGMTIDGRRAYGYVEIKRTEAGGMVAGEIVMDEYKVGKEMSVISRDDFIGSYIKGWERGFMEMTARR